MEYLILSAVAGLIAGVFIGIVAWRGRLARGQAEAATLRGQLAAAGAAQMQLAELRAHLSGLRHDIRGILSPALLVADRLVGHGEPSVRRAGDVMVRTVERAVARLGETRLDETSAASVVLPEVAASD